MHQGCQVIPNLFEHKKWCTTSVNIESFFFFLICNDNLYRSFNDVKFHFCADNIIVYALSSSLIREFNIHWAAFTAFQRNLCEPRLNGNNL